MQLNFSIFDRHNSVCGWHRLWSELFCANTAAGSSGSTVSCDIFSSFCTVASAVKCFFFKLAYIRIIRCYDNIWTNKNHFVAFFWPECCGITLLLWTQECMVDEDCGDLKYCLYEIENSKCLPCIPTDMVRSYESNTLITHYLVVLPLNLTWHNRPGWPGL